MYESLLFASTKFTSEFQNECQKLNQRLMSGNHLLGNRYRDLNDFLDHFRRNSVFLEHQVKRELKDYPAILKDFNSFIIMSNFLVLNVVKTA